MENQEEDKEAVIKRLLNKINEKKKIIAAIKSGYITTKNSVIKISDIESTTASANIIVVNLRSGKTMNLSKEFLFINQLF